MAKGVKKIKWTGKGKVISSLSTPNKKVTIVSDQVVTFEVDQWYKDTTEEDKKKSLTWIYQDRKKQTIINQRTLGTNVPFEVNIPPYLCGSFEYYLEASFGGKRDLQNETGLYISGSAPAKLVSSKWSQVYDGEDIRKTHFFAYGEKVYLNLKTEGLNGHHNLQIEIFRHLNFRTDPLVFKYYGVQVIDGEINLEIASSFNWYSVIKNIKEIEEFYIKIYDPITKIYITDEKGLIDHAAFLRIKKKIVSKEIKPPTNLSPLKKGEPDKNAERYELCKFETISITEPKKEPVKLFNNGKNLSTVTNPKTPISKTILFDFEKYDITPEAKTALNNVLQYLLQSHYSTIEIDGHACIIGKEQYNQKLSQQRSDAVKKLFVDGGLDARRIISIGRGEVNPTDDKNGRDNIKYKNEKEYVENRRVDIAFDSLGHDAQTIVYETIAPSHNQNITIDITEYQNKACFTGRHKKNIKINSTEYTKAIDQVTDKLDFPVKSDLSWMNPAPLQYIWPKYNLTKIAGTEKNIDSANIYFINVHSCRYFSNNENTTIKVMVYPDIKWTLEFKWNHTQPFAYSFGNKLHPHDIKEGQKKAIGSEIDRGWSKNYGEMNQSFELSLKAQWDAKSQTTEIGKEFADRIAKTLKLFNKIKSMTESIANSPLSEGKTTFEIKAPVIAVSVQWYLQKTNNLVGEIVEIGVETKPLVEANFTIDLISIFIETAGNGVCPGAGKLINWVINKLGKEAGIKLFIIFSGAINVAGKTTINVLFPAETIGELKVTGELKVVLEFKAWAKGKVAVAEFEGLIKADLKTSVTGGLKFGADKKGIYSSPIAEFGGIVGTFVASGTVKFGIYKKSLEYESPPWIIVEKNEIKFNKYYLDV